MPCTEEEEKHLIPILVAIELNISQYTYKELHKCTNVLFEGINQLNTLLAHFLIGP